MLEIFIAAMVALSASQYAPCSNDYYFCDAHPVAYTEAVYTRESDNDSQAVARSEPAEPEAPDCD